jgi:hypothetical protein
LIKLSKIFLFLICNVVMTEGEGPRPGTLYICQIHAVVHYYINQYISGFDLIVISCSIHAVSPSLPSLSSLRPPTKEAPKGVYQAVVSTMEVQSLWLYP